MTTLSFSGILMKVSRGSDDDINFMKQPTCSISSKNLRCTNLITSDKYIEIGPFK